MIDISVHALHIYFVLEGFTRRQFIFYVVQLLFFVAESQNINQHEHKLKTKQY